MLTLSTTWYVCNVLLTKGKADHSDPRISKVLTVRECSVAYYNYILYFILFECRKKIEIRQICLILLNWFTVQNREAAQRNVFVLEKSKEGRGSSSNSPTSGPKILTWPIPKGHFSVLISNQMRAIV